MINKNGPKFWSQLLEEAPEGSILMGGAVIDWVHHSSLVPHDFDIWCPNLGDGVPMIDGWQHVNSNFGEDYMGMPHLDQPALINAVHTYSHSFNDYQHCKVQLMSVINNDPASAFSKFDHTLTLGSFSETGLFVHSMVYESFETKTVTCINQSDPYKSKLRALSKVKRYVPAKWGEWKFIDFGV